MAVCAVAVDTRWRAQGSCHETAVLVLPGGGEGQATGKVGFHSPARGRGRVDPSGLLPVQIS
jgi:hypothetical protein